MADDIITRKELVAVAACLVSIYSLQTQVISLLPNDKNAKAWESLEELNQRIVALLKLLDRGP